MPPGHGEDGVASFLEAIGTTGPVTEFTPLAYAGNDQGDVMAFIRYAFTVTATGRHATMNMHHYWKLRDGKACYVRNVRAAAGCTVRLGGHTYRATSPELVAWADDKALIASAFNPVLRAGFRILGRRQIMRLRAELTD